jgi:uncharacterized membrane protein
MPSTGFWVDFRGRFTKGLAALLPTLLTVGILLWAYDLVNRTIGQPINRGFVKVLSSFGAPGEENTIWRYLRVDPIEDAIRYGTKTEQVDEYGRQETIESIALRRESPDTQGGYEIYMRQRNAVLWRIAFNKYWLDVVGFVIAIVLCYVVGLFLASFIGRTIWRYFDSLFKRLPIIKAIYPNVKQVTDFLFDENAIRFGGVIAVQYPRKGIWSIGLQTGAPLGSLTAETHEDLVSVFVPSSPTPFTGYVIQVSRAETIDLPISIDDALRFLVSGGVIKPAGTISGGMGQERAGAVGMGKDPRLSVLPEEVP